MYKIILDEGLVIRISDNKIVAPCQSEKEVDFIEYNKWVSEGNQPIVYDTDPDKAQGELFNSPATEV